MCTVVIEVPGREQGSGVAVRMLAVRDEDPARPWDAPGEWWADRPGIVGVRDRRANGAWLAAAQAAGRLSVLLNRAETAAHGHGIPAVSNGAHSRGDLVLADVAGALSDEPPLTANFNLVSVHGPRAAVIAWDGEILRRTELGPGVHMLAHHDVDDAARTPRIAAWLPEFRELAGLPAGEWAREWIALLDRSAALPPGDDRAIIRDNRGHGYPTLSLLACLAEVRPGAIRLDTATLAEPGVWSGPVFERSL